jgi:hypothetical protein
MVNRHFLQRARLIVILLVIAFIYPACTPSRVSYVVVREKDFRVGPVDLPLQEEGKNEILMFLLKGGDHSVQDFVDPDAKTRYAGLFQLLSDPESLSPAKFRKQGEIGKVSQTLSQWFKAAIVYSLIDATRDRPAPIAPISVKDNNGRYWWVFYLAKESETGENLKIAQVLVTLAPTKDLQQYYKIK